MRHDPVLDPHHSVDSLVQYHRMSARMTGGPPCPRFAGDTYWNARRRRPMPRMCLRLSCPVCVGQLAKSHAAAIALARPDQHILLTMLSDVWATARRQVNRGFQYLREQSRPIEAAWTLERNPRKTGAHAHVFSRGAQIDEATLAVAARRAGLGIISEARPATLPAQPLPMLVYPMKALLDPPAGATELWPEARDFLRLNGGRPVHVTRGFILGADGRPTTLRRAAVDARRLADELAVSAA